jgi:preprotein translocase subunit SecE
VNQQSGSELARMLLFVAAVVALVILIFFAIGYGLGRLLL